MWRWVMVMLLLANALMFFWYAQQRQAVLHAEPPALPSVPRVELIDVPVIAPVVDQTAE
ncbi:MAG: hypothetical protein ACK4L8_12435 [Nitrincola lacisaponensis]|uniref:hypothetical protein n=1 Tax=Nitrincola lacisaponensis TaxID=267850 RepID=UPI0039191641